MDHIHTHYALISSKYLVFVFCKVLKNTRIKRIFSNSFSPRCWPRTGWRPSRSTARSTEPRAGRPHGRPTCIDRARLAVQWAGRPTGRPDQRSVLSGIWAVNRNWEQCSLLFSVDRAVDRRLQRSDFWPLAVDRPVNRQVWQTPTASFWQPIKLRVLSLFSLRF